MIVGEDIKREEETSIYEKKTREGVMHTWCWSRKNKVETKKGKKTPTSILMKERLQYSKGQRRFFLPKKGVIGERGEN